MLWGPTAVGKSEIVRQINDDSSDPSTPWHPRTGQPENGGLEVINNRGLVDLRVSLLEPSDLMGLPDLLISH